MSAATTLLTGGGISGASSIASTMLSNSANKKIAQMNNQFNERMLQKQMDYNLDMYNRQLGDTWQFYNDSKSNQWDMFNASNEYNSASSQRERLEAAGLNPYMMMNGGSAGSASSVSGTSASSPSAQGINTPSASQYSANFDGLADAVSRSLDAVQRLRESDKLKAEKEQIQIENKYKAQQALSDIYQKIQTTKNDKERVNLQKFLANIQSSLYQSQIANNQQNVAESKVRMDILSIDALTKQQQLNFLPTQQKLQVSMQLADIAFRKSQKNLTDKQARHEVEKMVQTIVSSNGQQLENQFNANSYNSRLEQQSNEAFRKFKSPVFGDVFNALWNCLNQISN